MFVVDVCGGVDVVVCVRCCCHCCCICRLCLLLMLVVDGDGVVDVDCV